MLAAVVTVCLLCLPGLHQIAAHKVHRKAVRALLLRTRSPDVPRTAHELAHAARSLPVRIAANAGWCAYLAGAVAIPAIFLR